MRMTFTFRGKMFLLTLVVWILLPVSVGSCKVCPPCCVAGTDEVDGEIINCFEQKSGLFCSKHFYIVAIRGGKMICINPHSSWLKEKREKGNLECDEDGGGSSSSGSSRRESSGSVTVSRKSYCALQL